MSSVKKRGARNDYRRFLIHLALFILDFFKLLRRVLPFLTLRTMKTCPATYCRLFN